MAMSIVLTSYVEQIQTTFETMRRRGLVVYDAAARAASEADKARKKLPKQLKEMSKNEMFENAYRDIFELKPLDATNKNRRNNLQELYFGVAVLIIAMCAGQMTGILWSASILSSFFDPFVELILVILLPVYAYLHLKQRISYDSIERRSWLFGLVFVTSVSVGDLFGARLLTANPSFFVILPFILAILIDVEFSPESFYAHRQRFLAIALSGSFLLSQSLAVFCGMMSFAGFLVCLLHCALLAAHFQLMEPRIDNDDFGKNEAQLIYILGALLLQIPIAMLFGSI